MLKIILLITIVALASASYSQDEYINFDKSFVKKILRKVKRDNLITLAKETDSTIVCAVRDKEIRDMVMILYFDEAHICNKVLQIFKVDSSYLIAFNRLLSKKYLQWTPILPDSYLSQYSKKLLLFKNPNAPLSFIIQHNKYMTKEEYNSFLPKSASETKPKSP